MLSLGWGFESSDVEEVFKDPFTGDYWVDFVHSGKSEIKITKKMKKFRKDFPEHCINIAERGSQDMKNSQPELFI